MIHAFIRNEDDSYEQRIYSSYDNAVADLADRDIIFMVSEDVALDAEITYEQPSKPYNRSIWWRRGNGKLHSHSDDLLNHLDKLELSDIDD